MDSVTILLKYVAPSVGCVTAIINYFSPMPRVWQVRREKVLKEFNPLPVAMITANCIGWTIYACIIGDAFVFAVNFPGFLMGLYMVATCAQYASQKVQDLMMYVYLATAVVLGTVASMGLALGQTSPQTRTAWGVAAVLVRGLYYLSPLSTLASVLRTRRSDSLHRPLCFTNALNTALWTAYGLAIHDWFLFGSMAFGTAAGLLSVALCLIFPQGSDGAQQQQQQQQGVQAAQQPDGAAIIQQQDSRKLGANGPCYRRCCCSTEVQDNSCSARVSSDSAVTEAAAVP